ncbi:MAG: Zn-finger in Ran binding protein [Bacteroidota bacterium]|jgi:rubrerythrin
MSIQSTIDNLLKEIQSERKQLDRESNNKWWKCFLCGTSNRLKRITCHHCGTPKKKK